MMVSENGVLKGLPYESTCNVSEMKDRFVNVAKLDLPTRVRIVSRVMPP